MKESFPPGHFYSVIPNEDEVNDFFGSREIDFNDISGINLESDNQYNLLLQFAEIYDQLDFPVTKILNKRYYYENEWFSYSDAIFLSCFLRLNKPKRIIEVGSGFSTAVFLDTIDCISPWQPEITLIEPNPERLKSLLYLEDFKTLSFIKKPVQKISPNLFASLEKGDFLFIDSSHVLKCGSDLQFFFNHILPSLNIGVFVHFHDIFYPFEYPHSWIKEGRYWNENYILRAYLSHNNAWEILFFNDFINKKFKNFVTKNMSLCTKNSGGSFYMVRVK